jgi:hypothetical protein
MKKITHVFTQAYTNWADGTVFDQFNNGDGASTNNIIMAMDLLEADVYRDRDFTIAHEMFSAIGI